MPGPRNDAAGGAVGLVVRGLEDERHAERGADFLQLPATSIWSSRDSTTQGPAIRNSGRSSPTSNPQSCMVQTVERAAYETRRPLRALARGIGSDLAGPPDQPTLARLRAGVPCCTAPGCTAPGSAACLRRWRRGPETDEQRMAAARCGSELGVELAADEPGVLGQLDHLAEVAGDRALGTCADTRSPGGLEPRKVVVVDLVAMAVALGDGRRCRRSGRARRARHQRRRAARPGAWCRRDPTASVRSSTAPSRFCHSVISAITGCGVSGSNSVLLASREPATWRAYSITASCMPRQMPR